MKKLLIGLLIPFCGYTATAQTKTPLKKAAPRSSTVKRVVKKPTATVLKPKSMSTLDSASYAFGSTMASSLKSGGLTDLNYDLLVKGLKETFAGKQTLINQEDSQRAIANLFQNMNEINLQHKSRKARTF